MCASRKLLDGVLWCLFLRIRFAEWHTLHRPNGMDGHIDASAQIGPTTAAEKAARLDYLFSAAYFLEARGGPKKPILVLNDVGTKTPICWVHAVGGTSTEYRQFAKLFGKDQPFFCVQVPVDKRNAEFASSITGMARYYAQAVIEYQPKGLLIVGGHSLGGVLALELAQQLSAAGREVALLISLDGEIFNTGAGMRRWNPLYLTRLAWNFPRLVRHDSDHVKSWLLSKWNACLPWRRRGSGSRTHPVEKFLDTTRYKGEHRKFAEKFYDVRYDYCPKKYAGRVVVIEAQVQWITYLRQLPATWHAIAPHAKIVTIKGGTHQSVILGRHSGMVVERLKEEIAAVSGAAPAQSNAYEAPQAKLG